MNAASQKKAQRQLIPDHPATGPIQEPMNRGMHRLSAQAMGMRRKVATAVLIALSLSLGAYAVFGHDGIVAYLHKQNQAQALQQKIQVLQKENERLALHDQRLQGDRDTIEFEAREQMHYTRPGEVIYTLPVAPGNEQHKSK